MINMFTVKMSFRRSPRLRNLLLNFEYRFLTSFELTLLIILFLSEFSFSQDKDKIDFENCTYKDFPLHGKIKFVDSFPGKP